MTGSELVQIIADRGCIPRPSAKAVVAQMLRAIVEAAARGQEVSITRPRQVQGQGGEGSANPRTSEVLDYAGSRR